MKDLESSMRNWFTNVAEVHQSEMNGEIARRLREVEVSKTDTDMPFRIKEKECYNNALRVAFAHKMQYVFGYMIDETIPLPIMHAWNGAEDSDVDLTVQQNPSLSFEGRKYFEIMRAEPGALGHIMPKGDSPFWDMRLFRLFEKVINGEGPEGITVPDPQVEVAV